MSSEPAIRVEDLTKIYRIFPNPQDRLKHSLWLGRRRYHHDFPALSGVSFEVERGETFGMVGRNGSGKTTLLQILAGTMRPTAGHFEVRGRLAALLELGAGFNPDFTGRENVFLNASLLGLSRRQTEERIDAIARFAEIGSFFEQPVQTYSSGMFVRLAFATAVHLDPEILVIDEALAVGDEAFQRRCFAELRAMQQRGVTIVFVSHAASAILELCDRAMLLDAGERLLVGPPKRVVTAYHRLLFAPAERAEAVREEIRALDRRAEEAGAAAAARPRPGPSTRFDPQLRPKSTTWYEERGARIHSVEVLSEDEEPTNLLEPGEGCLYRYRVTFERPALGVRFGLMIKTVSGIELAGRASHPPGEGLELVEAGTTATVTFRLVNRFAPGPYFMNAGCTGIVDGEEVYLHRGIDVQMFRSLPGADPSVNGYLDLAAEGGCRVTLAPTSSDYST